MKAWFEVDDWEEILKSVPELPSVEDTLLQSLKRFGGVSSVDRLREVLETVPYRTTGSGTGVDVKYDPNKHFDAEWADSVIRHVLTLLEAPTEPLRRNNHAEDWFSMNIWAVTIDKGFLIIPGITVERKEVTCIAGARRKNRDRTSVEDRSAIGCRLDGVVRTVEDEAYEYAGIEVAITHRQSL